MLGTLTSTYLPDNGTLLINTNHLGETCTSRHVDRGVHPMLIYKSVYHTTGILIPPHDLSRIVHIIGNRILCSWERHINWSERTVIIKETTIFPC